MTRSIRPGQPPPGLCQLYQSSVYARRITRLRSRRREYPASAAQSRRRRRTWWLVGHRSHRSGFFCVAASRTERDCKKRRRQPNDADKARTRLMFVLAGSGIMLVASINRDNGRKAAVFAEVAPVSSKRLLVNPSDQPRTVPHRAVGSIVNGTGVTFGELAAGLDN